MSKLIHLPNIDRELDSKLVAAGIATPDQLREKGSRHVFLKIKTMNSSACFDMLVALEGAVQGKLADELMDKEIEELKLFMEIFNR